VSAQPRPPWVAVTERTGCCGGLVLLHQPQLLAAEVCHVLSLGQASSRGRSGATRPRWGGARAGSARSRWSRRSARQASYPLTNRVPSSASWAKHAARSRDDRHRLHPDRLRLRPVRPHGLADRERRIGRGEGHRLRLPRDAERGRGRAGRRERHQVLRPRRRRPPPSERPRRKPPPAGPRPAPCSRSSSPRPTATSPTSPCILPRVQNLTATQYHPFWDVTRHAWVSAGSLTVGDTLRAPTVAWSASTRSAATPIPRPPTTSPSNVYERLRRVDQPGDRERERVRWIVYRARTCCRTPSRRSWTST
jgi:hypothetical protein